MTIPLPLEPLPATPPIGPQPVLPWPVRGVAGWEPSRNA
jgi:hypothetical protein